MKNLIQIFNETLNTPDTPATKTPTQTQLESTTSTKTATASPFKIKPSMVGSPCLRKNYYAAAYVPEDYDFDLSGKKRMVLGDAIHEMLHGVFKKAGILIEYYNPDGSKNKDWKNPDKLDLEFPLVCPDIFIKKGKIDAVLIIDGELWLGEYKSINMKGFSGLMAPKPDHVIQAVIYWYVFNKLLADGAFKHIKELEGFDRAKGVRWLYVNKDDTELKEFTMTDGDKIFTEIVEKIMKIRDHFERKELPEKTKDWCTSCPWRTKCSKNYNIT